MRSSSEVTEEGRVSLFISHIIREDITLNAFSVEVFSRSFARVMLSSAPTSYFLSVIDFFRKHVVITHSIPGNLFPGGARFSVITIWIDG